VSDAQELIRAAGGVVWRHGPAGIEIALVHRPKYDDWSLPKGKLEPGESALRAAVREVGEELGSQVGVSRRLGRIRYRVETGPKVVDFWLMRHTGGEFRGDHEVDDARWLVPADARAALSYDVERDVLDRCDPVPDSHVVLVRHAHAGKRAEWHGNDNDRPLDEVGRQQAERLAHFLALFAPDRICAAHPLRCVQTVQPLARALGRNIEIDGTYSDAGHQLEPDAALDAVLALAEPGCVTVLCSQGDAIPGIVERLAHDVGSGGTRKGAAWVLGFRDGKTVSADYYAGASG
jgi:phosphohistidine phosphatase SixA/8-oxo-dGTP pyrophosphatase MutT (NUDIX family)